MTTWMVRHHIVMLLELGFPPFRLWVMGLPVFIALVPISYYVLVTTLVAWAAREVAALLVRTT